MRTETLVLLVATAAGAHAQTIPPADTTFAAVERAAGADMTKFGIPGLSIAFVDSGRIVYAHAFGVANVETGQPLTPDMLFRTGSISKVVTALTVVSEARARGIPLDTPIGRYWTGLAPAVERVTLHQLLTLTAGVADIVTATPIADRPDQDELVRQFSAWTDTMFFGDPGDVMSYSNPGYALAGAFIEEVSHRRFTDLARERVFAPLGLADATFLHTEAVKHRYSEGHIGPSGTPPVVDRPIRTDARWLPPTFLWASAPDLARLEIALMDHGRIDGRQALDSTLVDLVTTPHVSTPLDPRSGFTYGLFSFDDGQQRYLDYVGRAEGYRTFIDMHPASRRGWVVEVNRFDVTPSQTLSVLRRLESPAADPRVAAAESRRADPASERPAPSDVAGHYANGTWSVDIVAAKGGLEFRGRGSPTAPRAIVSRVFADGDNRLVLVGTNPVTGATTTSRVAVLRDAHGRVKYLFLGDHAIRRVATP